MTSDGAGWSSSSQLAGFVKYEKRATPLTYLTLLVYNYNMANKWIHRLSNINVETRRADCEACGNVKINWRKPNKFRCAEAVSRWSKSRSQNSTTKFLGRKIYFIKADNGLTKIGLTKNVEERFKRLQAVSPCILTLLFTLDSDDAYTLEQEFHSKYSNLRKHGEWFLLSDIILEEIKEAYLNR